MIRRTIAVVLLAVLGAGCGGKAASSDTLTASPTTAVTPVSEPTVAPSTVATVAPAVAAAAAPSTDPAADLAVWCSTMTDLVTGGVREPATLFGLYDTAEAHTPKEIAGDMANFLRLGREVSTAFAGQVNAKTEAAKDAQAKAALASLSPEARAFLVGLVTFSQTEQLPGRPALTVFNYMIAHCP